MALSELEAEARREALIELPSKEVHRYTGKSIYSINSNGLVIAVGATRIFYPWNRVASFTYHNDDTSARQTIQGY